MSSEMSMHFTLVYRVHTTKAYHARKPPLIEVVFRSINWRRKGSVGQLSTRSANIDHSHQRKIRDVEISCSLYYLEYRIAIIIISSDIPTDYKPT